MTTASSLLYDRIGGVERIRVLLRHFYADVRQHALIGPVFARHIQDWPEHISKIAEFWSRVTGGPSRYSGNMPGRHFPLGLKPEHFRAWLGLWEANCRIYLPAAEAEEMIQLAHGIARRLQAMIGTGEGVSFLPIRMSHSS